MDVEHLLMAKSIGSKNRIELLQHTLNMLILQTLLRAPGTAMGSVRQYAPVLAMSSRLKPGHCIPLCTGLRSKGGSSAMAPRDRIEPGEETQTAELAVRREFGNHQDPALQGKQIIVQDAPATIVGVAPRSFVGCASRRTRTSGYRATNPPHWDYHPGPVQSGRGHSTGCEARQRRGLLCPVSPA
jgi:hypothetical protein